MCYAGINIRSRLYLSTIFARAAGRGTALPKAHSVEPAAHVIRRGLPRLIAPAAGTAFMVRVIRRVGLPFWCAADRIAAHRVPPGDGEASVDLFRQQAAGGRRGCWRGVFVGRAGELAALEAAAAAARCGEPRVVLVEGEGGAGKSTLLARFASGLPGATVVRASGDEAELLLPYGVVGQLVASARGAGGSPPGLLAAELSDGVDPVGVGADLVVWLGQFPGMVLALIDDLQWADGPSARALLFAVRRLQADRVLVVVSARPGELARLGEGWLRFFAGDHRAGRLRLAGLGPEDVVALSRALGLGALPRRAACDSCWRRRAVTHCIAGLCWRSSGSRALTGSVGRWVCRVRWPGWCCCGWAS